MSELRTPTVCAVCGELIFRQRSVAYRRDEDDPQLGERPWLHSMGMEYERRGIAPHNAVPVAR